MIGTYTPSGGKLTLTLPANSVSTLSGKYSSSSSTGGSVGSSSGSSTGSSSDASNTKILAPVADAYVQDGSSAGTNFGKSQQLMVKTSTAGYTRRTYLQFNLSSITTINSATMQLFGSLSSTSPTSPTIDVLDVSQQSSTENSLDWNNKPGYTAGNIATFKVTGSAAKYYSIDLTSYLKARKKAGATLVTLMLQGATTSSTAIILDLRKSANPPKLVVA